jgi:hypothetical protein
VFDPEEAGFANARLFRGLERGVLYEAEREGLFYLILDESAVAEPLPDPGAGVTIYEFVTALDRERYLRRRGWA